MYYFAYDGWHSCSTFWPHSLITLGYLQLETRTSSTVRMAAAFLIALLVRICNDTSSTCSFSVLLCSVVSVERERCT